MKEIRSPQELVADLLRQAPRYTHGIGIVVWMPDSGIRFVPRPGHVKTVGFENAWEPSALRAQLERLMRKGGKPFGTFAMWNGLTGGRTKAVYYPECAEEGWAQEAMARLVEVLPSSIAEGVFGCEAKVIRLECRMPCVECEAPMPEDDRERELCDACLKRMVDV